MKPELSPITRYFSVQALRGVAAMAVVLFHVAKMVRDKLGGPPWQLAAGGSGVDIFFAISGFVMILTTAPYVNQPCIWATFLKRRVLRIAPLYWLMTAAMAGLLLTMPGLAQHSTLRPWHVMASFLFIPAWNAYHEAVPLLVVGWTLSFEMFFYLLFTLVLAMRLPLASSLSVVLCALAAVSLLRTDAWGAPATLLDPILLEFLFGIWIGIAALRGKRLPIYVARLLAPFMIALLCASCLLPTQLCFTYRVIIWGIPSAILLASMVALEGQWRPVLRGFPQLLGDASYAIYLSHGFVITFVSVVLARLHLSQALTAGSGYVLSICLSIMVGIAVHRAIEQPLITWLRGFPAYARMQKVNA